GVIVRRGDGKCCCVFHQLSTGHRPNRVRRHHWYLSVLFERGAVSQSVSQGILAYVGYDRDHAVPGRYPSRVDGTVRGRVMEAIAAADAEQPAEDQGLFEWAEESCKRIATRFQRVSGELPWRSKRSSHTSGTDPHSESSCPDRRWWYRLDPGA